jgi:hypothetical protein
MRSVYPKSCTRSAPAARASRRSPVTSASASRGIARRATCRAAAVDPPERRVESLHQALAESDHLCREPRIEQPRERVGRRAELLRVRARRSGRQEPAPDRHLSRQLLLGSAELERPASRPRLALETEAHVLERYVDEFWDTTRRFFLQIVASAKDPSGFMLSHGATNVVRSTAMK